MTNNQLRDLSGRYKTKYHIDYNTLYDLYIIQNKTIAEISKYLNLSIRTITYLLRKEKIKKSRKDVTKRVTEQNLKKYGITCTLNLKDVNKKARQTCIQKYGTQYSTQNKEIYNKIIRTNLKKYGVKFTSQVKEFIKKREQTCLIKYGYKNATKNKDVIHKGYLTKKKNHTFNTSKPEKEIYKLLLQKFPNTKYQYKSIAYPFNCDFYVPEKNLYIEYQGYWHHNNHPFNPLDKNDKLILNKWIKSSKNKETFCKAIKIWTEKDPLKRRVAKENGLNWIEFFSMKEFMEWYEEQ